MSELKLMTESKLLDRTLELINDDGTGKAYEYLLSHLNQADEWSSQAYNFLYCLAATSGHTDEAIQWVKEAIIEKGLWYRPEVFEDDDLETIRENEDFIACVQISEKRYNEALKSTRSVFTWEKQTKDQLLLILHGNQQNNEISKIFWSELVQPMYQVEYLQSSEMDSCQLFRWNVEGEGPAQLATALNLMKEAKYSKTVLSGFSAGCNTILRAITTEGIRCDNVILFSPWMPIIESAGDQVIETLKLGGIEVVIICGELDEDCIALCQLFESKAKQAGLSYEVQYLVGVAHAYPEDLTSMVLAYL